MTRVLVVDDDKNFLQSVGYYLATQGYESIPARDGMEALVKMEEADPQVILLDVLLPKLNGFEVCRRIREAGGTVPIILTSAVYKKPQIQSEAVSKFGATDYLVKPIKPEELVERIKKLSENAIEESPKTKTPKKKLSIEPEHPDPSVPRTGRGGRDGREDHDSGPDLVLTREESRPLRQKPHPPLKLEGDIHKDTIAALILHIHRNKASGVLEIFSRKEKRMIFILDGKPVFASSFTFTDPYTMENVLRIIRDCLDLDKGTYYFDEGLDFLDYVPTYDLPLPFH